jgi:hypothetical protein
VEFSVVYLQSITSAELIILQAPTVVDMALPTHFILDKRGRIDAAATHDSPSLFRLACLTLATCAPMF